MNPSAAYSYILQPNPIAFDQPYSSLLCWPQRYEPGPLPTEPLDELFERGVSREKLDILKARFPEEHPFTLLRFLKARDGEVENAATMFSDHITFRASRPTPAPSILRSRVCYAAKGRDLNGNGLVVYRGDRHDASEDPLLIVDAMGNAIRQAMDRSTSRSRKVTLIVFSAKGTPTNHNHIKTICKTLADNFPETLAGTVVFPTNSLSRGIWHVIKYFLDPVVRQKVVLLRGGREPPDLQKYIAVENIPAQFGGTDGTCYDPV